MRQSYIITAAIIFFVFWIQCPSFSQDGREAFPMSLVRKDPLAMGMGGANLASTSSMAWSSFGNSAKIPFIANKFDAQASYLDWQVEGAPSKSLGIGVTFKITNKLGVSLGASSSTWDEMSMYSNTGMYEGKYTPNYFQTNVGFGCKILPYLSFGVDARLLHFSISDDSSLSGVGADLLFMTDLSFTGIKGLKAVAGITQIGTVSSDDDQSYKLPSAITFGSSYSTVLGEKHGLDADLDANYFFNSNSSDVSLGCQYDFKKIAFARLGYHLGGSSSVPSFATAGLGVQLFGAKLDAAYVIGSGGLKNSIIFGCGYSF